MKLLVSTFLTILISGCGGSGSSTVSDGVSNPPPPGTKWLVDTDLVQDGGPGKDGIPAIDFPLYNDIDDAGYVNDAELVIGIKVNGVARAYPHAILNWHEIVNVQTGENYHSLIYCPLTGTASLWTVPDNFSNKTFGVSGKLYNSNIIAYDRDTDSNWVQMLAQSVNGALIGDFIETNAVIETSWATWKKMYPDTTVLSRKTGYSRDYTDYPYGRYLTNNDILFKVANRDNRMHFKARVLGVSQKGVNKVYLLDDFNTGIEVLNENSESFPYVVIGSSDFNFAVAYSRIASDGTVLTFTPVQSALPVVMEDNEGNQWDGLGNAVSGTRQGQKLTLESDFIAFWFAWVAIHPNPTIHNFF